MVKNAYEKYNGKYITKVNDNQYVIIKQFNKKRYSFGCFNNFDDAVKRRDYLIEHNWVLSDECKSDEELIKEYYIHIQLKDGKKYQVLRPNNPGKNYLGTVRTIEEALYYRDLAEKNNWIIGKPDEYDLITDNPYIHDGLKYPLPERLQLKKEEKKSKYGKGSIYKKGPESYVLTYGGEYYSSHTTYEHAYYTRLKLRECGWDKNELPRILREYPKWYTWLLDFYRYVQPMKDYHRYKKDYKWLLTLTPKNNGKLENIHFTRLEDALWERDLYVLYDYNVEDIVYAADDRANPYYNMELPPYPERFIRNNIVFDDWKDFLIELKDIILDYGIFNMKEVSRLVGVSEVTVRNRLNKYDIGWRDFVDLCLVGEDLFSVLECKEQYYKPDLSKTHSKTNNVYYRSNNKSNPWLVAYDGNYYGYYPSKKMANKVVSLLKKCNWDKNELPKIRKKVGFTNAKGKRYVYPVKYKGEIVSYNVRHKIDGRMVSFGTYKDFDLACSVRDKLVDCGWDKSNLEDIIREVTI